MDTLLRFLKQPSTLKGILALLTAVGVQISPAQATAIVSLGAALYGCYQVLRDEDKQLGR